MNDFIDMNDLIDKANEVMAEMETAYGPKKAHRMAANTLDTLCRYDDATDPRPFLEQFLYHIIGTFENCSKLKKH